MDWATLLDRALPAIAGFLGIGLGAGLDAWKERRRFERGHKERRDEARREHIDRLYDMLEQLRRVAESDASGAIAHIRGEKERFSPAALDTLDEVVKLIVLYAPGLEGSCKELIDAVAAYKRRRAPVDFEDDLGKPGEEEARALRVAHSELAKAITDVKRGVGEEMRKTFELP